MLKLVYVAYASKDLDILHLFCVSQRFLETHLYFQDMRGEKAKEENLISSFVQSEVEENSGDTASGEHIRNVPPQSNLLQVVLDG